MPVRVGEVHEGSKEGCHFCKDCAVRDECDHNPRFMYNGMGMVLLCDKVACPNCDTPMDEGINLYRCPNCKKYFGYDKDWKLQKSPRKLIRMERREINERNYCHR